MDRDQLRSRQAALKARYTQDPATALTPLAAEAVFTDPGITCTVSTWAGDVRAGLHRATGGDGLDACSADMLLQALLGCVGVTMRSVATAMRLEIRSARLEARSTFDARGTLGLSRAVPVGMGPIEVRAELDTDATEGELARLGELTERYCVVGHSLALPPVVRVVRQERGQATPEPGRRAGRRPARPGG